MKCINCGTENEITAKFCRGCGTPIGNTSYLPDLFPKLKLVPKEFATLKSQTVGYIFFVLLNTILVGSTIAAICWGFYVFGDMYDKEWYYSGIMKFGFWKLSLLVGFSLLSVGSF